MNSKPSIHSETHENRIAAALRENLRKRKAQQQARLNPLKPAEPEKDV